MSFALSYARGAVTGKSGSGKKANDESHYTIRTVWNSVDVRVRVKFDFILQNLRKSPRFVLQCNSNTISSRLKVDENTMVKI